MFVPDFTKTPEVIVVDLINDNNSTVFTPGMFVFNPPEAIPKSPPVYRNTRIHVKATTLAPASGTSQLYYNRLNIQIIPGSLSTFFNISTDIRKISDLIPFVNHRYRVNLTKDDYVDSDILEITSVYKSISLVASKNSLVFNGALELFIRREENGYPLMQLMNHLRLNAFFYTPTL